MIAEAGNARAAGPQVDRAMRFESLFRAHHAHVLAYARRRVPQQADDVLADTFAIAWRRLDDVPIDAEAWLYGVARRVVAGRWRSRDRQQGLIARLIREPSYEPEEHGEFATLHRALETLREADREALMLVHWEQLSPERAARSLGITRTAFNQRVHRAHARLRKRLEEMDR